MPFSKSEMDEIMNEIMGPKPQTKTTKKSVPKKSVTKKPTTLKSVSNKKAPLPTYDGYKYLAKGIKIEGNAKNFIDGVKASKSKVSVISAGVILPLSINKVLAKFAPELKYLGIQTPRDLERAIKTNKNINLEHFQIKFTQDLDTKDYKVAKQLQQKLGAKVEIDDEPKKKKVLAIEPEAIDVDKIKDSSNKFERMMSQKGSYLAKNKKTGEISSVAPKYINDQLHSSHPKFSGDKLKNLKTIHFGDFEITKKSYILKEPSFFEKFLNETLNEPVQETTTDEPAEEFDLDNALEENDSLTKDTP